MPVSPMGLLEEGVTVEGASVNLVEGNSASMGGAPEGPGEHTLARRGIAPATLPVASAVGTAVSPLRSAASWHRIPGARGGHHGPASSAPAHTAPRSPCASPDGPRTAAGTGVTTESV